MTSLIGGLQVSTNPGRNMTPGVLTPRRTRVNLPMYPRFAGRPNGSRPAQTPGINPNGPSRPPAKNTAPAATGPYMPVGGVAAHYAAPGSSILSFDQWLASQPTYILQHAHDVDAQNQLLAGYGFYKDKTGHLVADPKAAQDSIIAGLDLGRQQGIGRTAQRGANAGNLFSGATLLGTQQANDAYRTGASKALGDLTGKLGDIDQKEIDTKLGLQPDYTDMVGNTKTQKPEDVLKKLHGEANSANAIASIDAYLKSYSKYLTPAQIKAFQNERARHANIAQHRTHHAEVMAQHRPLPKKKTKKRRKPRHPTTHRSGHTGGVAGGSEPPPNMR
jgi:hypothetical protein